MQGIAFNRIRQKDEPENHINVIECVAGERIEQQLEFELNRNMFRFDTRHLNSKNSFIHFYQHSKTDDLISFSCVL